MANSVSIAIIKIIHYLPIITTCICAFFSISVLARYRTKTKNIHLLWWGVGILIFGVGTFVEGYTSLFGWHQDMFRTWYIAGALLGGAPLAQGTVYLMLKRRIANRLTVVLVLVVIVAATCVLSTPINHSLVEPHRLSGKVIAWPWVRWFSPFLNLYAVIFLVGGAALSAYRFSRSAATSHRFKGNVLIAIGALLPGIGGAFTRFGYTEVLYVAELLGISLIYVGYRFNIHVSNDR